MSNAVVSSRLAEVRMGLRCTRLLRTMLRVSWLVLVLRKVTEYSRLDMGIYILVGECCVHGVASNVEV